MGSEYIHIPHESKWVDAKKRVWICYIWWMGRNVSYYEIVNTRDQNERHELKPEVMKEHVRLGNFIRMMD